MFIQSTLSTHVLYYYYSGLIMLLFITDKERKFISAMYCDSFYFDKKIVIYKYLHLRQNVAVSL